MSSTHRTDDAAKALSKIALEPRRRQELWNAIEQRIDMDTEQNMTATFALTKRRNCSSCGQLGAAVAALVLSAIGITYGAHYESLLKTTKSTTGTTNTTSVPTPKSTIQLTLTLPNGQTVKPDQTVAWKDLSLSLIITSLPPANAGPQIFGVIMGDQTNRISQETVSTSIGSGELWYTQRKDFTYAYYVIVNGSQNAYVFQAVVTGNSSNAKSEVTSLLNSLHVSGGEQSVQQEKNGLVVWHLTSSEIQQINAAMIGIPFNSFYLPYKVVSGDTFESASRNGSTVTMKFQKMLITESPQALVPNGKVVKTQTVSLQNKLNPATVYTLSNNSAVIGMHIFTCYVLISAPSLSLAESESILAQMTPLNG